MKMKIGKICNGILLAILMVLLLSACTKSMSYSFTVETGDKIKVKLDTTDGYSISQKEGTYTVSLDGTDILTGLFLTEEMYGQYLAALDSEEVEILEESEHNGCTYTEYRYTAQDHTEHNFVCWVTGSSTGVLMGSVEPQQAAEEAFLRLTFSVE